MGDGLEGAIIWQFPRDEADAWAGYILGSLIGLALAGVGVLSRSLEATIFGAAVMYWFVQRAKSIEENLL